MRRSSCLMWFGSGYLRRIAEQGQSLYETFSGYDIRLIMAISKGLRRLYVDTHTLTPHHAGD